MRLKILFVILWSANAAAQDRNLAVQHVFPIVVDGTQPDGATYRTSLVLQNTSGFGSTCLVTFQGTAPPMQAPDGTVARGGVIQQVLPPGTFDVLRSPGTGPLTSGYVSVACSLPIAAYAIYSSYMNGTEGELKLVSETTSSSSTLATGFQFINDSRESGRLAISVANDNTLPAQIQLQVFDLNGRLLATTRLIVAAKASSARFLDEAITALPANHVGAVRLESNQFIYATGLRFSGTVLTSIPPSAYGLIR